MGDGGCVWQPPLSLIHGLLERQGPVAGPRASQPCPGIPTVLLPSPPAAPRSDSDLCVHSPAPRTVTHPCRDWNKPWAEGHSPPPLTHPARLDPEPDPPTGHLTPHQPAPARGGPTLRDPSYTHTHTHTHTHTEGPWGCTVRSECGGLGWTALGLLVSPFGPSCQMARGVGEP